MSVVAAAVVYTGYSAAKESKKNRQAGQVAINSELELSKEQYETYKTQILPLELEAKQLGVDAQQLALQRGQTDLDLFNNYYAPLQRQMVNEVNTIEGEFERVSRDAANDVDKNFALVEESKKRNDFQMGLRPDSGRTKGANRERELEHAATRSFAINRAVENEKDRVEDLKFNRKATILGRQPNGFAPTQASPGTSINPNSLNNSYGNQAAMYGRQAANDMQSAGDAFYTGANLYARFKQPSTTNPTVTAGGSPSPFSGNTTSQPSVFNQPANSNIAGIPAYEHGGLVEGERGVDRVPATIDDNQPARLTSGEFVIPKDVVDKKGTEFFEKMIQQFHEGAPEKKVAGLNDMRGTH